MTAAAAVVRWAVLGAALVGMGAAKNADVGVVDVGRCRNGCSAVPEDLWPACCEIHNTCCQEFAESCMHDCLPRVHTGDVSAVEERPGMCCALYNLCCFRETFRISSSRTHPQEPVSFPIVHRFHVPPATLREAISPAPRPAFLTPKQALDDQDPPTAPKRPSQGRLQLSKKPFRPEGPQGFKRPGDEEEERPSLQLSGLGQQDEDREKPKFRPKFGFLANRKDAEERRKEAEERRKLEPQGEAGQASEVKVTRRPATADIRQEVVTPEVMEAQSKGPRRLDASINPVVTRKRMLPSEVRQASRTEARPEVEEPSGGRVRKLEVTPAREGRTFGGRSRPSGQQTPARTQPVLVAGQENPRPAPRRPSQAAPTSTTAATPKAVPEERPSATVAAEKVPQPLKESESPVVEQEASSPVEVVVSAPEKAKEADTASAPSPKQPAVPEEDQAGEPSQTEGATDKEPSAATEKEEAKPETVKDEKSAAATPETEKAAFVPPEIEVNVPQEPQETSAAAQDTAAILEEPVRIRGGGSRSRSSAQEQPSTAEAAATQNRSRGRASARRQSSRTASQPAVEGEPVENSRRSRTRG